MERQAYKGRLPHNGVAPAHVNPRLLPFAFLYPGAPVDRQNLFQCHAEDLPEFVYAVGIVSLPKLVMQGNP